MFLLESNRLTQEERSLDIQLNQANRQVDGLELDQRAVADEILDVVEKDSRDNPTLFPGVRGKITVQNTFLWSFQRLLKVSPLPLHLLV